MKRVGEANFDALALLPPRRRRIALAQAAEVGGEQLPAGVSQLAPRPNRAENVGEPHVCWLGEGAPAALQRLACKPAVASPAGLEREGGRWRSGQVSCFAHAHARRKRDYGEREKDGGGEVLSSHL